MRTMDQQAPHLGQDKYPAQETRGRRRGPGSRPIQRQRRQPS